MKEERIALSQRERDRLQVLHEVERKHLRQREAAQRLGLSARQGRRLVRGGWEGGGPPLELMAMIADRTSRFWGRLVEHDSTEENLRTLQDWLRRYGRPVALYTDKGSVFAVNRLPPVDEQLAGEPAPSAFGRGRRGGG